MLKRNKVAIVILLCMLLTGFMLRHKPIFYPCDFTSNEVPVIAVMDNGYDFNKVLPVTHNIVIRLVQTANDLSQAFILVTCLILCMTATRRLSHIEYCGRKMVRAIMLQWHPD